MQGVLGLVDEAFADICDLPGVMIHLEAVPRIAEVLLLARDIDILQRTKANNGFGDVTSPQVAVAHDTQLLQV
jgi:hypothetical protein